MQGRVLATTLVLALAGCAAAPVETVSDPVIAGTRYRGAPIELGPVRMLLTLRDGDVAGNARLTLGVLATGDAARVVLSRAQLRYGGKPAELVTRHAAPGTAMGCADEGGAVLDTDYWFNAAVTSKSWSCVTLAFLMPGRKPGDVLELRMEPLNVGGELVHTLPVTFTPRAPD